MATTTSTSLSTCDPCLQRPLTNDPRPELIHRPFSAATECPAETRTSYWPRKTCGDPSGKWGRPASTGKTAAVAVMPASCDRPPRIDGASAESSHLRAGQVKGRRNYPGLGPCQIRFTVSRHERPVL